MFTFIGVNLMSDVFDALSKKFGKSLMLQPNLRLNTGHNGQSITCCETLYLILH